MKRKPSARRPVDISRHGLHVAVLSAVAVLALQGCGRQPSDTLARIEAAAAAGDARAFADCFTKESQPFAEALVILQKNRSGERSDRQSPIELLSPSKVLSERIEGDRAVVTVSAGGTRSDLVFTREDGRWKLNVSETESARRADPGVIP